MNYRTPTLLSTKSSKKRALKSSRTRLGGPMSSSASNLTSLAGGATLNYIDRIHRRHPSLLALKDVISHQKEEIEKFSNHHRTLNREIEAQDNFIRNL